MGEGERAELPWVMGGGACLSGAAGSYHTGTQCDSPMSLQPPDLAQLRKKFEEDKQRIELMRAQRKFRPY